jgi:molybdopterin biosynthesis enzyme MoaB
MEDNGLLVYEAVTEDRWAVLDMRGRQVGGFTSQVECAAFVQGYLLGRADAGVIAQHAISSLPGRIAGDR